MTTYGMGLFPQHAEALAASGITPEHAHARGYVTVDTKVRLEGLNITKAGRRIPGLLVPQLRPDGSTWGYQYRPDEPRERDGKPVKYETPMGQRNGIDVPPGVAEHLDDPTVPLWVTEGVKKADAGAEAGLCIVALPGVWSWVGSNSKGGKVAVPDWRDIALNGRRVVLAFDGDVARKKRVHEALGALAAYLSTKGAEVEYLHLPDEADKVGLDDYLVAGHSVDELRTLVRPEPPALVEVTAVKKASVTVVTDVTDTPETSGPPEDGADLLAEVETFVRRFCVLPHEDAYVAVVLWCVHTYFMEHLDTTGRLACLSPEPSSGKTRVLEVLDVLSHNPLLALDLSMSAFFRIVDDKRPTILLDEVDAIFTGKAKSEGTEDLRRVINNGYRVGAVVQRVGGANRDEVQSFRVFAPVAMAGLGQLPDTLMSRSIILRMRRRAAHERVEPWRDRIHRPEGRELQTRLARWAKSPRGLSYPVMPEGVADRDADVWEPLLMVADLAGGDWPERARAACLRFIRDKPASSVSLGVRLLTDLRSVWPDGEAVVSTVDLLDRLADIEEAPWGDLYGEGLKPRKLAQLLGEFDAAPTSVRTATGVHKGYRREDLWDAWQRYTPTEDTEAPAPSQENGYIGYIGDDPESDRPDEPDEARVFEPPTGPGRCAGCGFHIATQGHRAGCAERTSA